MVKVLHINNSITATVLCVTGNWYRFILTLHYKLKAWNQTSTKSEKTY